MARARQHLRILFLCHELKEVGTYFRAYHLARGLSARGHDVTLMAVSPDSRFRTNRQIHSNLKIILTPRFLYGGYVISRLTSCRAWGMIDIYKRIRVGMSSTYDIIQTFEHLPNVAIPFRYLRKRSKAKLVSDWCDLHHLPGGYREIFKYRFDVIYRNLGFVFRKYLKSMELDIRRKADAVTVISGKLKEIARSYGVEQKKISIIEGGADVDAIKPLPRAESRSKLDLPLDGKIIGFLGKAQFDLDILIKSFAKIKKTVPKAYLVIVGKNLYPWTKRLAADLGVLDSYIEVGHCPEELLPYYLSSADVFALPMKRNLANEARWPNKIGEYMASGRPTVVSNVGDIAGVVRNYEIGLVAEPSEEDFSEKLLTILSNERLAEDLGRKARQVACEKYSWTLLAARLEQVYFRLVGKELNSERQI